MRGMNTTPGSRTFAFALSTLLLLTACGAGGAFAADHAGTMVLTVDGKKVTLDLTGGGYASTEEGKADYFEIGGEKVILSGEFDMNKDGKTDGKDKLAVDDEGDIKPASMVNKPGLITPSDKDDKIFVALPGLGKCAVLKGSTFTVTKYRKVDGINDRWSGTVSLRLKPEKGAQKTVTGTFDSGTGDL